MIDERLAMWALAELKGLGPAGVKRLIERFGTAAAVFEGFVDDGSDGEVLNEAVAGRLKADRNWGEIEAEMNRTIPPGAEMVAFSEQSYPSKLKNIPDPPSYFYYAGDLNCLEMPSLAIVGSRKPSDYGHRITSRLAGELASAGVTIISGLAFGIDSFAHEAALEAGGLTAAVFGCGLDYIYPSAHRDLAERIARSGCLISEFPRGTKPERFNFPVRNRIISGLSDGVLVVEANEKSGALVTARLALEHNREVLAVPGSVDNQLSYGPNDLIKQGAVPVTSIDDIMANFGWHKSEKSVKRKADLSILSREELSLYNQLSIQPTHLDNLGKKINLGPSRMAELLLNLEIKGFILRKPGNYVVKA